MAKEKKLIPIDYTSRDFSSIRKDLEEYAKIYYPDTVKDFSDAGFASLMLDTVSYVGDILSFYLDYNVNESFMTTAIEYNNIIKHAEQLGYKIPGPGAAFGEIALYILAPAASNGAGPDATYCPVLRRGSRFTSDSGATYVLIDDVDFASPDNQVVVAESVDGTPSRYAIKTYGQVMSGELEQVVLEVGEFEKFLRLEIPIDNVTEVISVFDEEGHPYYEVDYLTQNIVYRSIPTTGDDRFLAPNILKALNPKLITFNTSIKGDVPKFVFAQSITLTPGTVTVSVNGDEFKVHAINNEAASGLPGDMEKRVKKIYEGRQYG